MSASIILGAIPVNVVIVPIQHTSPEQAEDPTFHVTLEQAITHKRFSILFDVHRSTIRAAGGIRDLVTLSKSLFMEAGIPDDMLDEFLGELDEELRKLL